jgi:hypothetical protein
MKQNDKEIRHGGRTLQYSSNRGRASHRVRYVESSAPAAGECMLCVGSLADLEGDLHFYGPINDPRPLPMQLPMQLPIPLST